MLGKFPKVTDKPITKIINNQLNIKLGQFTVEQHNKHTITVRNKFDAHQEISETFTPNDEYQNFVNAHIEAAAECIPTKLRAKRRVL